MPTPMVEMYFLSITAAKINQMAAAEVCCKPKVVMKQGQEATKVYTGGRVPNYSMRNCSPTITTID